jgi:hypothetical protein
MKEMTFDQVQHEPYDNIYDEIKKHGFIKVLYESDSAYVIASSKDEHLAPDDLDVFTLRGFRRTLEEADREISKIRKTVQSRKKSDSDLLETIRKLAKRLGYIKYEDDYDGRHIYLVASDEDKHLAPTDLSVYTVDEYDKESIPINKANGNSSWNPEKMLSDLALKGYAKIY